MLTYNHGSPLYSMQGMGNDYRLAVADKSHVFLSQGRFFPRADGLESWIRRGALS